jgi:hypothetical protein
MSFNGDVVAYSYLQKQKGKTANHLPVMQHRRPFESAALMVAVT